MAPRTIHLHPTAPLAERVLLPGDPGRALLLAQSLLEKPAMFNHNRGLWGYTGVLRRSGRAAPADGPEVTIQSTGMGGPSAAIVIAELAELGARQLIRVGTCGALDPGLGLGELLIATRAIAADGTSRALSPDEILYPDPQLVDALRDSAGEDARTGAVASTDLFYDGPEGEVQRWVEAGAAAVEMETATLFALARRRGLRTASLLLVSDLLGSGRVRIETDRLRAAEERLGRVAAAALEATLEPSRSG